MGTSSCTLWMGISSRLFPMGQWSTTTLKRSLRRLPCQKMGSISTNSVTTKWNSTTRTGLKKSSELSLLTPRFADQTEKYIYTNGEEETVFADKTIQRIGVDGKKTLEYPNGTKVSLFKLAQIIRTLFTQTEGGWGWCRTERKRNSRTTRTKHLR